LYLCISASPRIPRSDLGRQTLHFCGGSVTILPRASGGFRYLFVGIDTSTKWMEVVPAVNITHEAAVKKVSAEHHILIRCAQKSSDR
jgi:hypothetical protein